MSTTVVVLSSLLLILQAVSWAEVEAEDTPQIQWKDVADDHGGIAGKQYFFINANNPVINNAVPMRVSEIDPEDVHEMQIPPPPTQEPTTGGTTFEDNDTFRSGAGNLQTNEIGGDKSAFYETESSLNNKNDKGETNENEVSTSKSYNFPDLDKAVENAVNNLHSSQESPLVPLVQLFSEKIKEEANSMTKSPEDLARDQYIHKFILLKLAKKAQEQKKQADKYGYQTMPAVQEQKGETQRNVFVPTEDAEPCDCDGGCFEVIPTVHTNTDEVQTEKGTAKDQTESERTECDDMASQGENNAVNPIDHQKLSQDQSEQQNSQTNDLTQEQYGTKGLTGESSETNQYPRLLAHILVTVRKPDRASPSMNIHDLSSPVFMNEPFVEIRDLMAERNLPHSVGGVRSADAIPEPTVFKNGLNSPRDQMFRRPSSAPNSFLENGNHESSEEVFPTLTKIFPIQGDNEVPWGRRSATPTDVTNIQEITSQHLQSREQMSTIHQELPRELILLKLLSHIVKQKVIANALEKEHTTPFIPTLEERTQKKEPSGPSPPLKVLYMIHGHGNDLLSSQLPPLHFPNEASGYKIKNINDFRGPTAMVQPREAEEAEPNGFPEDEMVPSGPSPPLKVVYMIHGHGNDLLSSQLPPFHFPNEASGDKIKNIDDFRGPTAMVQPREAEEAEPNGVPEDEMVPSPLTGQSEEGNSQEMPWFIKNIIASITRPHDGLQPVSSLPTSPSQNAATTAPVLLKGVLAPYAL